MEVSPLIPLNRGGGKHFRKQGRRGLDFRTRCPDKKSRKRREHKLNRKPSIEVLSQLLDSSGSLLLSSEMLRSASGSGRVNLVTLAIPELG